jgi:hypothetical protein
MIPVVEPAEELCDGRIGPRIGQPRDIDLGEAQPEAALPDMAGPRPKALAARGCPYMADATGDRRSARIEAPAAR